MKNNQLIPFERNRYYPGKMLTATDCEAEQTYSNNKRRFINQTLYGSGIICGLGVVSLDDLSILVESGVGFDDYGREIVVNVSEVTKLSAIAGFETLKTNEVMLCLRYKEQEVHSVYCINYQETGKEYENNRIHEEYEIFLMDAGGKSPAAEYAEDEFLFGAILYEDEDYVISLQLPSTVSNGSDIKIELVLERKATSMENQPPISFASILQLPIFTTQAGTHQLKLEIKSVDLAAGAKCQNEYWIGAKDVAEGDELVLNAESLQIMRGEQNISAEPISPLKIKVENISAEELVNREIGKTSLEMRMLGGQKDYLTLAWMKLTKTDSAYLIEQVREQGVKKYIAVPAHHFLRNKYLDYFSKEKQTINHSHELEHFTKKEQPKSSRNITATGVLEIPLGEKVRRGDIRYSAEIMHGLGKGNVYVTIGAEYFTEETAAGANMRSTLYGNPELFPKERAGVSNVETAVRVLNDKGSFVVAAKIVKEVSTLVLSYRWIAVKIVEEQDGLEERGTGSIAAVTPTVVLEVKESHFFEVKFYNMSKGSISYELTEEGSGEITVDGVYTAPNKEGVYEIRMYCTELPILCTYAYAIVKGK